MKLKRNHIFFIFQANNNFDDSLYWNFVLSVVSFFKQEKDYKLINSSNQFFYQRLIINDDFKGMLQLVFMHYPIFFYSFSKALDKM
jgi:hypothetical protein